MPAEYLKKKNKTLIAITVVGVISTSIILLGGLWLFIPYIGAKGKLVSEQNRFNLTYKLSHQTYRSGQCLDNCPVLETAYNIPQTTIGAEREGMVNLLKSQGYVFDSPSKGDTTIFAHKDKFYLYLGLGGSAVSAATLNQSADDSTGIQQVVFTLDYSP